MSSTQACWRKRARRRRVCSRRSQRSVISLSTRSPSRSSKLKGPRSFARSCSASARCMPVSLSSSSWSRIGWVSIGLSPSLASVVVPRATDVVVCQGEGALRLVGQRLQVELVLQDRFDALEAGRADAQRTDTRRFEAGLAVAFAEPQDAEAGPEALLRMAAALEDLCDQRAGGRAGLVGPGD